MDSHLEELRKSIVRNFRNKTSLEGVKENELQLAANVYYKIFLERKIKPSDIVNELYKETNSIVFSDSVSIRIKKIIASEESNRYNLQKYLEAKYKQKYLNGEINLGDLEELIRKETEEIIRNSVKHKPRSRGFLSKNNG